MHRLFPSDLDHVLESASECWNELAGARLFITGGTGFVGKWLLESLLWANDRLDLGAGIVVLTRDPGGFRTRDPHIGQHAAVELLQGDAATFRFPSGDFPFVIHAATLRSFPPDSEHPASTFDGDVAGTRRVLEFARTRRVRRLLLTSSGTAYGKQPSDLTHLPESYAGAPLTTDNGAAYAQAKRVSEFLCTMYARQFGFAALIARLFAFVGPYLPLDQNFAVGNFIRDALAGGPIRIHGDGTPYRSYLYAADMAAWLWTILVRGESARVYNVGSDQAVTIAELARAVADEIAPETRIDIRGRPEPGAPPLRYVPSIERARGELNLRVRIPLREGISRTAAWAAGRAEVRVLVESEASTG